VYSREFTAAAGFSLPWRGCASKREPDPVAACAVDFVYVTGYGDMEAPRGGSFGLCDASFSRSAIRVLRICTMVRGALWVYRPDRGRV
jgi:hypothetical protein